MQDYIYVCILFHFVFNKKNTFVYFRWKLKYKEEALEIADERKKIRVNN